MLRRNFLQIGIFDLVGINYEKTLLAPGDRPVKIMDGGKPISSIMV